MEDLHINSCWEIWGNEMLNRSVSWKALVNIFCIEKYMGGQN